jgi:NAD(P)-dependent dehydrogenase (short-subunit alcohol dehydrogenase family)
MNSRALVFGVGLGVGVVLFGLVSVLKRDRGGFHGFSSETTALDVINSLGAATVRGKRILVTGATNGGIGFETARVLALAGATVLVHARSEEKAVQACRELRAGVNLMQLEPVWADLADLAQTAALGRQIASGAAPLHAVILNAGVLSAERVVTGDGFEQTIAVNTLSPLLLFNALLPKLVAAGQPTRVVWVASLMHAASNGELITRTAEIARGQFAYDASKAYAESKLGAVILAQEANRRFQHLGVTSVSLHPGQIITQMVSRALHLNGGETSFGARFEAFLASVIHYKSIAQGAATSVYCVAAPEVDQLGGRYFSNAHVQSTVGFDVFGIPLPLTARRLANDADACARFYDSAFSLIQPF